MTDAPSANKFRKPRILMFSQRNIFRNYLYRCSYNEFEDIVCQIDSVDLLTPQPKNWFNVKHKIAKRIAWNSPIALNPGITETQITGNYDLFFAIFGSPAEMLTVNTVKNWKDHCKTSICLVDEFWITQIPAYKYLSKILAKFDIVLLYYSQSVKAVSEAIGRRCEYLPPGVDSMLFCPHPSPPDRVIDVYSMGRRSEITHRKLIEMFKEKKINYIYDSISGSQAICSDDHRLLLANMAKRSRYFVANPAFVDLPEIRGKQIEAGNRYFEGAASGSIMIGERPDNDEFKKIFSWPDAVIQLPYGSDKIEAVIREIDNQPERQKKIRRDSVVASLTQHDWACRWETILKFAGLKPLPALLERKKRLFDLSELVIKHDD